MKMRIIGISILIIAAVVMICGCTNSAAPSPGSTTEDGLHSYAYQYAMFAITSISGVNNSSITVTNDMWNSTLNAEYFQANYRENGVTHTVRVIIGAYSGWGGISTYNIGYYNDSVDESH